MSYVHINRPSSTRFQPRVRYEGHRKYVLLGGPVKSQIRAIKRMASAFANGGYKRGDVLIIADYYEPVVVAEIVRR